jgi:uncharacterized protein
MQLYKKGYRGLRLANMRTITLEEHFATPDFLDGPGLKLKNRALSFGGAAQDLDQLPVSSADRARIAHRNAEPLLGIV